MLAWFGVFGAPFAWAAQHAGGIFLTLGACDRAGRYYGVSVDAITIAVTVPAALIAVLSGVASVLAWRANREVAKDDPPPQGRVFFLSVVGMTTTPLFFFIIVMSGSGVLALELCRQS